MRGSFLVLLLFAAPVLAHAAFLDCLFFDGFESPGVLGGSAISASASVAGLQVHNCARKTVVPAANPRIPLLTWNVTAAAAAQTWANQCMFAHGDLNGFGQNIYAAAGFTPTLSDAATAWVGEQPYYNYASNTCSAPAPPAGPGTCGHYTQVVWRTTASIGCGFAACTVNSPFAGFPDWDLIVCDYNPPGNDGNRPY